MTTIEHAPATSRTIDQAALAAVADQARATVHDTTRAEGRRLLAAAITAARQLLPGATGAIITLDLYDGYHQVDALIGPDGTATALYDYPAPGDDGWDSPTLPANFDHDSYVAIEAAVQTALEWLATTGPLGDLIVGSHADGDVNQHVLTFTP